MRRETNESEGAQNGQSGHAFQSELEQREEHDDEVEYVPAFLEVEPGAEGDQLEGGLDGERGREKLERRRASDANNETRNQFSQFHRPNVFHLTNTDKIE